MRFRDASTIARSAQQNSPGFDISIEGQEWNAQAICPETDPEMFFPEKGGSTRAARQVCGTCSVRPECLEWALERDIRWGVWGGMTERDRRALKKQREKEQVSA